MDKPIAVGDLVVMVRPTLCCGYTGGIGKIYRVVPDTDRHQHVACMRCGASKEHSPATTIKADNGCYYHRVRLKRIPPLEELDDVKREEEITA